MNISARRALQIELDTMESAMRWPPDCIFYYIVPKMRNFKNKTENVLNFLTFLPFRFAMNSNFCIIFRASFLQIILSITSASGQRIEHQRADGLERQLEG